MLLREAEVKLIKSHESIKSVPYNGLSESFFERVYANSEGAFRSYSKCQAAIYLYARAEEKNKNCLLYTSPSPRDMRRSRMPSSA